MPNGIMSSKVLCQLCSQDSTNFTGLGQVKHLEGILICGNMLLAERFLYKNANVSSVTEAVPLHDAMTPKITQCALKLQDQNVIAKLSPGDLVAQEAKYHSQCLVKLYNTRRLRSVNTRTPTEFLMA